MSELKVDKVSPRSGNYVALNTVGSKNIVINGDMSIAQRATSASSLTSTGYYTVDRWQVQIGTMGTWTQSQSTDVPSGQGFASSLKMDCTTADAAPAAGDYLIITSRFEGQNLQYLKKGTASATSLTLSFWVKSTKTGTFVVQLFDSDNTRQISKSYTVNVSNTWEKKTITFAGDTTGAYDNDNSGSLQLNFWLGAGSTYTSGTLQTTWAAYADANSAVGQVNVADSTSNDFLITGVQLEAGTTASDFEFLPHDVNLQRCFRYYYKYAEGNNASLGLGGVHVANQVNFCITFPTQMRANPTVDQVSGTNYYTFYHNTTSDGFDGIDSIQDQGKNQQTYVVYTNISATAGECGIVYAANASAYLAADAEL